MNYFIGPESIYPPAVNMKQSSHTRHSSFIFERKKTHLDVGFTCMSTLLLIEKHTQVCAKVLGRFCLSCISVLCFSLSFLQLQQENTGNMCTALKDT